MRKILIVCLFVAFPMLSVANADSGDAAKVYYKNGTVVETSDFNLKLNFQIQSLYTFTDYDSDRGAQDTSDFGMKRARIKASGQALEGLVGYQLENDFVGTRRDDGRKSSDLISAFIDLNLDDAAVLRSGQFKVPYGAQELVSTTKLQFVNRSISSNEFTLGEQPGAMLYGDLGEGWAYGLGVSNGNSDGEGRNYSATDTKHLGALQLTYACNYDRTYEGDVKTTDGLGYTMGINATVEEGELEGVTFDQTRVGGDLGLRTAGLSLFGQIDWRTFDLDGADDSLDDLGYVAQVGYFVAPEEVELAARFSAINYDSSTGLDEYEYAAVVNYFLNGHDLKVQGGITWLTEDPDEGNSLTDTIIELMLSGYF